MSTALQTWFGGIGSFTNPKDWSPPGSPSGTNTLVITSGRVQADNLTITNPTIQLGSSSSRPTLVLDNTSQSPADQIHVQTTTFNPAEPRLHARIVATGAVTLNGEVGVGKTAIDVNQLFPANLTFAISANSNLTLGSEGIWFSNDGSRIEVKPTGDGATFVDNGEIDAYGGKVIFDLPVSGTAYFKVAWNNAMSLKGSVEFKDSVSSGTVVNLNAGTLKLDGPLAFHGTIEGFNAASSIELVKLQATFTDLVGGVLRVFDGMHEVAALNMAGISPASQFQIKDSGGNSYITLAPPSAISASAAVLVPSIGHQFA